MTLLRLWTTGVVAILAWANLGIALGQQEQTLSPRIPQDNLPLLDLQYVNDGNERHRLNLYLPKNKGDDPSPVIVWIHGGGWRGGNKEICPAIPLVAKGYVVASINYRLSQHAVFPAQIEDCKAAIRWLRANAAKYHIDPSRIGVWGGSAGGHLVALLGTNATIRELDGPGRNFDQSCRVQCVVDWYGPTDFVHWDPNFNRAVYSMITQLLGCDPQADKQKARNASPVTYVNANSAPFLIIHGDRDDLVPLNQSEMLAEALKKANVEVTLQIVKNGGHGGVGFGGPADLKIIEDFFTKHLGKTEP